MDPNAMMDRIVRLLRFDTSVFDEVKDDPNETIPAVIVALVSAFLAGLGAWLYWTVVPDFELDNAFVNSFILGGLFLTILYGVAVLVTYVILVQAYRAQVDLQSLIRTMGYAALPLALSVLMFIPVLFPLFALVPMALLLVMMIYAVRAATSAEAEQVVIATTVGFAVMVLVLGLIAVSSSVPDAPIGAGQFGLYLDL